MPIFLIKSLLSLLLFGLMLIGMFTMFEILARPEKRFDIERLKRIHRINGYCYVALSVVIAYFCLDYIWRTRVELSPRSALHGVFALAIASLLFIKISIVRFYKGWYGKVPLIGLSIVLLTFQVVGTSAGYYFFMTHFGKGGPVFPPEQIALERPEAMGPKVLVRTDPANIEKGRGLAEAICIDCHELSSTQTVFGPGLKGVLKNSTLPASGRPATPENVFSQLRRPFKAMPSFADRLSDEEALNIIAFLNTL